MSLLTLQWKEVKWIFGEISAKYQAYSLTFWRKLAYLCQFSLYNKMKSNWVLVKFRQNTKPIALLFGKNGLIFATFHSTIKISQIDFWSNLGKIPSLIALIFGENGLNVTTFHSTIKRSRIDFWWNFGKIPSL